MIGLLLNWIRLITVVALIRGGWVVFVFQLFRLDLWMLQMVLRGTTGAG